MLYDFRRWEKPEIKTDPFKIESLIAWLEKQPADKEYEFTDCGSCALAQYFLAHGYTEVNMGTDSFDYGPNFKYEAELPSGWNDLVNPFTGDRDVRTFGGVLLRARKLARK